ncbi:unnamed protein product [Cyprideis torosa]|uniref:Dynein heavy chain tail domain-containing protein n=1 Tax=Cyprideis torosa TaxID=163714 RepID=A0A7R8ZY44_9CRUS|nr:unnamed protein product [Cyprideis torosa]CAG0908039.1 unnamed protein product [Cyprideis torosa]
MNSAPGNKKVEGIADLSKKEPYEHMLRATLERGRLTARMEQMRAFRVRHEQLRPVITRVLRPGVTSRPAIPPAPSKGADLASLDSTASADVKLSEEIDLAYEDVKEVDCLDITREGTEAWKAAVRRYDERIDRVETRITAWVRKQLGEANDALEMGRSIYRFKALFVRPRIRGAIRECLPKLMNKTNDALNVVKKDLKVSELWLTAEEEEALGKNGEQAS